MTERFDDEQLRVAYAPLLRQRKAEHGSACPTPDALLAAISGKVNSMAQPMLKPSWAPAWL